jgi:signal transduction histidine kinase
MFKSIRTKIMVLQIGLVLTVTISLGIASYMLTFSALKLSQKENLEYLTEHMREQMRDNITHKEDMLEKIGHSEAVLTYFKKQQDNFLLSYLEKYVTEFDSLSYVNEKGQEELKLINGKMVSQSCNIANSTLFRIAINNPNRAVSSYSSFVSELNGPGIEFGYCEKDFFDDFVGYISGKISVGQIAKNLKEFKRNDNTIALLIDCDGTILASEDKDKLFNKFEVNGTEAEKILSEIKMSKQGYGRANIMGNDCFISYAPVETGKLHLITMLPYENFSEKLDPLKNTVILVGLTVLIAGFVLSMFVAADITEPVMKLLKSTSLIATGDFTQRVTIDTKDEMGRLAAAFNQMTGNLQKTTTSMVNLNKEIIERQKAEAAQQSLNEKLENSIKNLTIANRELADFAHVAAHDLKSPLRAIGSLAGIMLTDYSEKLDEQGKYYLDTLVKRTERMSELISGILTYSDVGQSSVIMPVNINETIRQALGNLQIPENIEVALETDFPIVYCNKTHMLQVFTELLNNAIKYIDKPKGLIRLKCLNKSDYWIFSISDNGRGIDPKYFDRIFKIFQTLIRRDEEESTGIGLSVVKRIVEKYNGKIWVESQPAMGSTFFFTLRKDKMEVNNEKLQTNTIS